MPTRSENLGSALQLEGAIRVTTDGTAFRVLFAGGEICLSFETFAGLIRFRKKLKNLEEVFAQLPPLPRLPVAQLLNREQFPIAVKRSQIGTVTLTEGTYKFKLTPFRFLKKQF